MLSGEEADNEHDDDSIPVHGGDCPGGGGHDCGNGDGDCVVFGYSEVGKEEEDLRYWSCIKQKEIGVGDGGILCLRL